MNQDLGDFRLPFENPPRITLESQVQALGHIAHSLNMHRPSILMTMHLDTAATDPEAYAAHMASVEKLAFEHTEVWEGRNIDAMTGLLNKGAWERDLKKRTAALENGQNGATLAVLFCDLDGFKALNDIAGHHVGDAVLKEVGKTLKTNMREGDGIGYRPKPDEHAVSRLGGDEYAITVYLILVNGGDNKASRRRVSNLSAEERVEAIKTRLTEKIAELASLLAAKYEAQGQPGLGFGISIGSAIWQPGTTAEQLVQKADKGMYLIKEQRKEQRIQNLPPEVQLQVRAAFKLLRKYNLIR